MSRRLVVLVSTLVLAAVAIFVPATAQAHSELVASSPAADSSVTSLTSIQLTFGDEIVPDYSTVQLTGPDGTNEELTAPTYTENNSMLTTDINQDALPNGLFTVAYSVVSIDGHPISGSYTFTLAQPDIGTVTEEPAASPTTTSLIEPRDANDGIMLISAQETQMPLWAVVLIVLGGLVVVAVVVVIIVAAVRRKK